MRKAFSHRIRLKLKVSDGRFVAYVVAGTTKRLHKGRNFVFFNENGNAYLLTSMSNVAVYNLHVVSQGPFTSDTPGTHYFFGPFFPFFNYYTFFKFPFRPFWPFVRCRSRMAFAWG